MSEKKANTKLDQPSTEQWNAWRDQQRKGWTYKSKILSTYGLTENQFQMGISDGIILTEKVDNPFREGTSATMVLISSVRYNLRKLDSYPTERVGTNTKPTFDDKHMRTMT